MKALLTFASNTIADVSIPDNIIVPCPKVNSGKQTDTWAAKHCPDCEYFEGVGELFKVENKQERQEIINDIASGKRRWSQTYAIRCHVVMEWVCKEVF